MQYSLHQNATPPSDEMTRFESEHTPPLTKPSAITDAPTKVELFVFLKFTLRHFVLHLIARELTAARIVFLKMSC